MKHILFDVCSVYGACMQCIFTDIILANVMEMRHWILYLVGHIPYATIAFMFRCIAACAGHIVDNEIIFTARIWMWCATHWSRLYNNVNNWDDSIVHLSPHTLIYTSSELTSKHVHLKVCVFVRFWKGINRITRRLLDRIRQEPLEYWSVLERLPRANTGPKKKHKFSVNRISSNSENQHKSRALSHFYFIWTFNFIIRSGLLFFLCSLSNKSTHAVIAG